MASSTDPSRRHWLAPLIAVTCVVAGCMPGTGPVGPTNVAAVTTFSDTGDGTCDSTCSLRDAIALANTSAAIDTVRLPTGTFVVGGGAGRASVHGRAKVPRSARAAGGPSGEAFAVTSDLTIEGAGAGSTVIDFSGDDFTVGWLASANLTLRKLTARNLGGGTAALDRDLIRADRASPGGTVTLDRTGIDHIQPDMAAVDVGAGASVVDVAAGSSAVAVTISSSTISDVGAGAPGNLVRTGSGGLLAITDSSLTRVPSLVVGGLTNPVGSATGSLTLTRVVATDTALAVPGQCLPGVAVQAAENAVLDIAESYLGSGGGGPCGGTQVVQGSPLAGAVVLFRTANIGGAAPVATVSRSTLDGQVSGTALVLLHFGPTTEGSNLEVTDSTLVGGANSAILLLGSVLPGSKRSLEWTTIVTPPDQQAAGIRTGPLDHVPLAITSSAFAVSDAPTCVGPVNLGSGGNNTAADDFCPLTGPGDLVTDPGLEPLGDHGGLGPTAAPRENSSVVDTAGACTGRDQRNVSRPQGAACDRGAVEFAEGVR